MIATSVGLLKVAVVAAFWNAFPVFSGSSTLKQSVSVAAAASARGFDLVAYHDPRTATWFTPATAIPLVAALGSTARPVYLQEPNRYPFAGATTADAFHQARLSAKLAGAAAW